MSGFSSGEYFAILLTEKLAKHSQHRSGFHEKECTHLVSNLLKEHDSKYIVMMSVMWTGSCVFSSGSDGLIENSSANQSTFLVSGL